VVSSLLVLEYVDSSPLPFPRAGDGKIIVMRKTTLMPPAAIDESLGKLSDLVAAFDALQCSSPNGDPRAQEWRRSADSTQWLTGLHCLLETAGDVVTQLQLGIPVTTRTPTHTHTHAPVPTLMQLVVSLCWWQVVVTNRGGGEAVPQVISLAQVRDGRHTVSVEIVVVLRPTSLLSCPHHSCAWTATTGPSRVSA
jgi:hypothetical protein